MKPPVRPRFRVQPLSEIVLYKLACAHHDDTIPERLNIDDIAQMFTVKIPKKVILSALDILRLMEDGEGKFLRRRTSGEDSYTFSITNAGIIHVERELLNAESLTAWYAERGDSSLDELTGFDPIFFTSSDRLAVEGWRPLQIDREDQRYLAAVTELEKGLETIRGDNGFAVQAPSLRDGIIESLETGLKSIKSAAPSANYLISTIISPLKWLITKFSGTLIAEAASQAGKAVWQFILHAVQNM